MTFREQYTFGCDGCGLGVIRTTDKDLLPDGWHWAYKPSGDEEHYCGDCWKIVEVQQANLLDIRRIWRDLGPSPRPQTIGAIGVELTEEMLEKALE